MTDEHRNSTGGVSADDRSLEDGDRPRVFISFASADHLFLRQFLSRLQAQRIEPWNFQDPAERIPPGHEIIPACLDQVDQCDVFVAVVSNASLESDYTCEEVKHALSRQADGHPLRLFIIRLAEGDQTPPDKWPEPYRALASRIHLGVDPSRLESIEACVLDICTYSNIQYVAPVPEHPRMPFLPRLVHELESRTARQEQYANGSYCRVMTILATFTDHVGTDLDEATRTLDYLCRMLEYEFPDAEPFYYPRIALASCHALLGQWTEVEAVTKGLERSRHVDENLPGLRAMAARARGDLARSISGFQQARDIDPQGPAILRGLLEARMLKGERVGADDADVGQFLAWSPEHPQERRAAFLLQAQLRAYWADFAAAEERLSDAASVSPLTANELLVYLRVLLDHDSAKSRRASAERTFKAHPIHPNPPALIHMQATVAHDLGRLRLAAQLFEKLLCDAPLNRQYRFDAALLFLAKRDKKRACQALAPMLTDQLKTPTDSSDFYYEGFARFVHGQHEAARSDFERSRVDITQWYPDLIQHVAGAGWRKLIPW